MKTEDIAIERLEARREECARLLAFAETGLEARSDGRDVTADAINGVRVELEYFDIEIERLREN